MANLREEFYIQRGVFTKECFEREDSYIGHRKRDFYIRSFYKEVFRER